MISSIEDKTTSIEDKTTSIEDETTSIEDETTSIEDETTSIEDAATSIEVNAILFNKRPFSAISRFRLPNWGKNRPICVIKFHRAGTNHSEWL
ncbi:hypothetical protein [Mangrovibacterium marinum]|uniref:hypothetical protein n=1 Tax=Mangrovibacterium marinum TaxID=1639118 RepID=UPI002A186EBC|nr:hypothetical protein [Mangrovibacterium marinum]